MKILVVTPKYTYFPVGIAYIAASMKNANHDVDCYIYDKQDGLARRLKGKYDIVATGGLSSQYHEIKEIVSLAKQHHIRVIGGGGIITSEPELLSKALDIDYAVIGEGEETVVELLACLEHVEDLSTVNGIGYFKSGKFILTSSRKQNDNLDILPWPDYDGFNFTSHLDLSRPTDQYHYDIFDEPREYPIITSRSCPYLCTFCYHPTGDRYRQRSVDNIMDEIRYVVRKYRINIISIYDELFSYNQARIIDFCAKFKEFIATLPWEVKWTCQMRVSGLKDEMLDAMRDSGCYMVSYGFESYSPIVLKSMKKNITPEQIHHAVHATLDRKISIQANFIFGDRAETLDTARETLEFWRDHLEAGILLAFIIACPNSVMYQHAIRTGLIKDRLDFIANHFYDIFNMTEMSEENFTRLGEMVHRYRNKYYCYTIPINRTSNSLSVRCPHCHKITTYNNFSITGYNYIKMMYCRNCRKRFFAVSLWFKIVSRLRSFMINETTYIYFRKLYLFRTKLSIRKQVRRILDYLRP
jgi:radical SAM superfamily enzyme YgiQ (UPF0313 family)